MVSSEFKIVVEVLTARYKRPVDATRPLNDLKRFLNTTSEKDFYKKCIGFTERQALSYCAWSLKQPGRRPKNDSKATNSRSLKTHKNYLAAIKRFFAELKARELIKRNPFISLKAPKGKKPKEQTRALTPNQVKGMFRSCESDRDRAILAVLFGGGLRVGEVQKLNLSDLWESDGGWVLDLVDTKNGDDAQQVLPFWAGIIISNFVAKRLEEVEGRPDAPIFVRMDRAAKGERLEEKGIRRIFQKLAKRAGIDGWIATHSARATAITQALNLGL